MGDILGDIGGFFKGLKPLMQATGASEDENLNVLMMQTDLSELKEKKKELLAKIGQAVIEDPSLRGRFSDICGEIDQIDQQIEAKETEARNAQKALEEKKHAEELALKARVCSQCGFENAEGTKFCSECGNKLGLPAVQKCGQCGAEYETGAKFCGECGARLS